MKLSFEDFDSGGYVFFICEEKNEEPVEFVFDDEPLEMILYGKGKTIGPTKANFYLPAVALVNVIRELKSAGKAQDVIEKASELAVKGYPLSVGMCYELVQIVAPLIPDYPNPLLKYDLSALGLLFENIWSMASKAKDGVLQDRTGNLLYRWYEHHQRYKDARQILTVLIDTLKDKQRPITLATVINNYGFEFFLEGRWRDATPFFQNAAEIFKRNEDELNYANARANFWMCKIECGEFATAEQNMNELVTHRRILESAAPWQIRKPLIILAKIEEWRGNICRAIKLVEQAIEADGNKITRYPEIDHEYLRQLKSKMEH